MREALVNFEISLVVELSGPMMNLILNINIVQMYVQRRSHSQQNHTKQFRGFLFIRNLILNEIFVHGAYTTPGPVPITL